MKIGVAGLGRMGGAIAKRLVDVGHDVVVWNCDTKKVRPLADYGAAVAASPRELADRADFTITILTDAAAIDAVYGGASGLLAADIAGKLFVEMSTVQPDTERLLADKVHERQASLLECPVGGTVGPALSGKLLGFRGRYAGGFRAREASPRPALPPRRLAWPSRCRIQHEARH